MSWSATLGAATAIAAASAAVAMGDVDAYRWKSRLLVVIAPDAGDPRLAEQARLFTAAPRANRERDLVLISESGATERADALRRRFGVPAGEFRAILVGKDGGAKLSSGEPIASARLFEEIDAMPMRRDEMQGGSRR